MEVSTPLDLKTNSCSELDTSEFEDVLDFFYRLYERKKISLGFLKMPLEPFLYTKLGSEICYSCAKLMIHERQQL